ncbi:hypothetical protein [Longimicrobium terrae]|uniref:Tetratricopeptide repeat protein n=1 Tax=Longimicrobium terrae TaxID=1639882 RepID=A0A841H4I3_9BACT|nr:hypothetical protein [Longimicrobium terrae]MBB4638896.1 hypothetical protein [Longimicrobium terrae]MBB6073135.1 hypothetical protein [Longimicrobium terrae]NNC30178.1 hypothetical protein [Longimicrobium terrae]
MPPAILHDPAETMEGAHVLWECRGELGLVLWRTVRDLSLWAATPPDKRGHLFTMESVVRRVEELTDTLLPDAIASPVDTLNGMLTLGVGADASIVTICCLEVATWARRERLAHTAIAFAQAGALVCPDFAEAALYTGVCASEAEQDARAVSWLRRALTLARREKDGRAYAASLAALGAIYERVPAGISRAEWYYRKAFKAGRRFGSRDARVQALRGLRRIALARGDDDGAEWFALAARRQRRPRSGSPDSFRESADDTEHEQ